MAQTPRPPRAGRGRPRRSGGGHHARQSRWRCVGLGGPRVAGRCRARRRGAAGPLLAGAAKTSPAKGTGRAGRCTADPADTDRRTERSRIRVRAARSTRPRWLEGTAGRPERRPGRRRHRPAHPAGPHRPPGQAHHGRRQSRLQGHVPGQGNHAAPSTGPTSPSSSPTAASPGTPRNGANGIRSTGSTASDCGSGPTTESLSTLLRL